MTNEQNKTELDLYKEQIQQWANVIGCTYINDLTNLLDVMGSLLGNEDLTTERAYTFVYVLAGIVRKLDKAVSKLFCKRTDDLQQFNETINDNYFKITRERTDNE